jgi:hypothetical protein
LLEERIGVLAALPFAPAVSRNADGIATRANWKPTIVQLAFLDLLRRNSRDELPTPPQDILEFPASRRAAKRGRSAMSVAGSAGTAQRRLRGGARH